MIHRDTSWYKGLYHWKMASACGLKAYLLYWYIMIQGSINKYSLGFFSAATRDTRIQKPKKFLGIDFPCIICIKCIKWRPDAIRDVSHDTVCLYHDVSRTARGRHEWYESGHDNSCPRKYVSTCITHVTCWFDAGKMRWYKMIHTCGEIICPPNP